MKAAFAEFVGTFTLTFVLVTAVYASGVLGLNGNMAGVAIGLVLTADILAGEPAGDSMNPARSGRSWPWVT